MPAKPVLAAAAPHSPPSLSLHVKLPEPTPVSGLDRVFGTSERVNWKAGKKDVWLDAFSAQLDRMFESSLAK